MPKEIVGLRRYSFKDKQTGERVEGYTVYLQWYEDQTEGVCCESVSLKDNKLDGFIPTLGAEVRVGMNKYGKVDFLVPVPAKK